MVSAVFKLLCADRQTDKNGKINAFLPFLFTYATKIEPLRIDESYIGFWLVN